jgi:ABC-type branched-subunit amino acid transport system substrate-binding protein
MRARTFAAALLVGLSIVAATTGGHRAPAQAVDSTPASTASGPVAVDRQSYVSDAPVDPYNKDQLALHVGAASGNEVSRSFIHLSLDGLPEGAALEDATLTLISNGDKSQNVNTSAAIVQACVLLTELPANVDSSSNANAPKDDCSKGSAVGQAATDGSGVWTFSLRNLAAFWRANGNTGAAIKPVADPTSQPWSLGFDKTLTGATATWTIPAASSRTSSPTTVVPATGLAPASAPESASGSGAAASSPSATSSTDASAQPAVSTVASPGSPVTIAPVAAAPSVSSSGVHTIPGPRSTAWVWTLLAALVAAALLVGQPVMAVATAGAGHVREVLTGQLQAHARAVMTSAVVVVWAVTFTAYSVVVSPVPRVIGQVAATDSNGGGTGSGQADGTAAANGATQSTGVTAAGAAAGTAASSARRGTGSSTSGSGSASAPSGGGSGINVQEAEAGLPSAAKLYSGADDLIGITDKEITLCGHAALVFGSAFNINASDLNVFWDDINARGGIAGRTFKVNWNDDTYSPGPAVAAAQKCKDAGTFALLGGIGFDQIPAVRVWAEQNRELYIHHVAVQRGSAGLRYSFTALPSVEQMGQVFGQLAVQKYQGKKVGILWRNSSNWQPGRDEFRRVVQAAGMQIVGDYPVQSNQGNYTQQLVELKAAGAEVVFAWENATAATEMLRQAKGQQYSPHWLMFPFNLTLQTVGADALSPPVEGVAAWPAYTFNNHGGPYASYAADLQEFERQYRDHDPNANLNGPGGDLLFLAWSGFKQLADLFQQCGRNCTRNRFASLFINGYHTTVSPNCEADFTAGDHHRAAPRMDIFSTVADSKGAPIWVPDKRCVANLAG